MESDNLTRVINEYHGKKHVRGSLDCNLMVLDVHHPEILPLLKGQYTDLKNGVAKAREVRNVVSMRQFLRRNKDYKRVSPDYQKRGDVVVFPKGFNCYLSLGDKWFGVGEGDRFGFLPICGYDPDSYIVFRRI